MTKLRTSACRYIMEYIPPGFSESLCLDARELDHLGPLFGFIRDELSEVSGRARKRRAAEVGKTSFHSWIGETCVDFLIELVDDFSRCVLGAANPGPGTCLIVRHEVTHGRNVGESLRAHRGGHRERAKPAGPDVLDRRGNRVKHDLYLSGEKIGKRSGNAAIRNMHHV